MSKYLEDSNPYSSKLFLVFPLLENTVGLKCKLKTFPKKNYKSYDSDIIWCNFKDYQLLNSMVAGSKGIKIQYFWLNNENKKMEYPEISSGTHSSVVGTIDLDEVVSNYNKKFKTEYKVREVLVIVLFFSKKYIWDDEKILSFLEELEKDYFSLQNINPPCSNCRYRFLKNLTRKCDYLYVEANISV